MTPIFPLGDGVLVSYVGATTEIDEVQRMLGNTVAFTECYLKFTYASDHITTITAFDSSSDTTGRTWLYQYDADGQLESVTAPSDADTPQAVTQYQYYSDATLNGLLQRVTDADGNATQYMYYPNRDCFQEIYADGTTESFSYNFHADQTAYVDARGLVAYYTYNNQGNTTKVLNPDRTTTASVWQNDLLQSATDEFGQTESYQYDANGNVTKFTDRLGHVTDYTYTDYSNPLTVTQENGIEGDSVTQYRYYQDAWGKNDELWEVVDADGDVTSYTYAGESGAHGLPESMTSADGTPGDPDADTTTYTYNAAGQVLTTTAEVSPGLSIGKSYTYDDRGSMLTSTDGNGQATAYAYDLLGASRRRPCPIPTARAAPVPVRATCMTRWATCSAAP